MTVHADMSDRVADLESEVRSLRAMLDQVIGRDALGGGLVPIRLARTCKKPVVGGPDVAYAPAGSNAYWIKFCDATFNEADHGSQNVTFTDRSAKGKKVAHTLSTGAQQITEGEFVGVFWHRNRYWLLRTGGGSAGGICFFTLNAPLAFTTASVSATVEQVGQGAPVAVNDVITVHNPPIYSDTRYVFEGTNGMTGKATYWPELNQWFIDWLPCSAAVPPQEPNPNAALAPQAMLKAFARHRAVAPSTAHQQQRILILP